MGRVDRAQVAAREGQVPGFLSVPEPTNEDLVGIVPAVANDPRLGGWGDKALASGQSLPNCGRWFPRFERL